MKCDKGMTFEECELLILRQAIDKSEAILGKKLLQSEETQKIIHIVEKFIRSKKRVCYGGTAINNILPKDDQFYNKDIELPDYDFFSPSALKDAKELADIYYNDGFTEVEAKSGVHHGTFKVFVNFIPVADITQVDPVLYKAIHKDSITVAGIYYAPPNYLRMAMYLELSRPKGDVSRWEKVLKRLTLLNKNYPLKGSKCDDIDFQRYFGKDNTNTKHNRIEDTIFYTTRDTFIDQGLIFFGAFAKHLYSKYMPKKIRDKFFKDPDFDVLSEDPETSAIILKERLKDVGIKNIKIIKQKGVGEIIASHYEVKIGLDTIAFIYKPLACHSYNIVNFNGKNVRIATLDTMLSFYLAFLYANRKYYDKNRILCMSEFLFKVQQKNRLAQKGVLRRFSIKCYGKQSTIESMRAEKTQMFKKLKSKRGSKEYDEWFLRYVPSENKSSTKFTKKTRRQKNGSKSNSKRKNKTLKRKNKGKTFGFLTFFK